MSDTHATVDALQGVLEHKDNGMTHADAGRGRHHL